MFDTGVPASSSVIAFVTSLHAALLVVHLQRVHGGMRWLVAIPALSFGAMAWVLTTPGWLAAGVAANLGWTLLSAFTAPGNARRPMSPESAATRNGGTTSDQPGGRAARPASAGPSFVPARVLAVIEENDTIRTFRLSRPAGFDFDAGQFLMVRVDASGESLARCYSISSAPGTRGYLEISVRRQGRVSRALHETVRPGDTLLIHPPLGRFTVPPGSQADLVLLAGGVGITPLMSMLRHAVGAEPDRRVTLLYSVRAKTDAAFRDEIESLVRRHPQVRAAITVTGDGDADGCRRGRIDEALIRETVSDLSRPMFLMCGPLPMIEDLRATLARMGVSQDCLRSEAFEVAHALAAEAAGSREVAEPAGRLRLSKSAREVEVRGGETLLEAAERAGTPIASFCRAGICGTCRTRVVSGDVRCSAEALSDDDRERGYVLPCVSWVAGDCVLEA